MQPPMYLGGVITYGSAPARAIREPMARCVHIGDSWWQTIAYEVRAESQRRGSDFRFKIVVIAAVLRLGLSIRAL